MSKANELIKLKEMLDSGLITKEEFDNLKTELLNEETISEPQQSSSGLFSKIFDSFDIDDSDYYEDKNDEEFYFDYVELRYDKDPEFSENIFIYYQSDNLIDKLIIQPYFEFNFNSKEDNWDKRNDINFIEFLINNGPYGESKIQKLQDEIQSHIDKNITSIKKEFSFLNVKDIKNYTTEEKNQTFSDDKLANKILNYLYNINNYKFIEILKGRRGKGWYCATDLNAIGFLNGINIKTHSQNIYDNHIAWHQNKDVVKEFDQLPLSEIENEKYPDGISELKLFTEKIEKEESEVFHSEDSSPHNLLLKFYFDTLQIDKWHQLALRVNGGYKNSWQRTQNEFTFQKHQWTSTNGIEKISNLKFLEIICSRVSGIGDKRSAEIAKKFDTLDELYELSLDEIKKAISPTYGERIFYYLQDNIQLQNSNYSNIKYLKEMF
tara:strand:+ start:104 stop:1411 length:1308 start_codon:yes stop_codon:yes gene_type:complete